MKNFPKYVKTVDGYIGTFRELDFAGDPIYRFPGGERNADKWEIENGSAIACNKNHICNLFNNKLHFNCLQIFYWVIPCDYILTYLNPNVNN